MMVCRTTSGRWGRFMADPFNPYVVLGLVRDSTEHQIKAAHRQHAKRLHPDIGGDRAAFEAVQRAYDLLMDPERRAHFDQTGDSAEPRDQNPLIPIVEMLAHLMDELLSGLGEKQIEPKRVDMMFMLKQAVKERQAEHNRAKVAMGSAKVLIGDLAARFDLKAPGQNVIRGMLEAKVRWFDDNIGRAEREAAICDRALALLDGYSFKIEPTVALQGSFQQVFGLGNMAPFVRGV